MILDAVLTDRRCWWLSPEADSGTRRIECVVLAKAECEVCAC